MKTRTPLDAFIDRLVQKSPVSDSILSLPRHAHAPEGKLPLDKHLERDTKRDTPVTLPGRTDAELTSAYRHYWTLPETEPVEIFSLAYQQVRELEAHAPQGVAWRTLRETASAFHAEMGVCPFCRERGPLHLPAEQISMELSGERP